VVLIELAILGIQFSLIPLNKAYFMSESVNKSSGSNGEKEFVEKIPHKDKSKGKTVKEVMKKHLADKNDIISDEDFKNLELNLEVPETETSHTPIIEDDKKRPKDEDKDPKNITPWDIINE
jgi:hypothetical protein